jgi:ATP-dependent DNA helicase RecG
LPAGLTLAALKRSHSLRPRNPIIADVAFKGGYIDAWGSGTLKIIDTCRESGLPNPEIIEQDGGILVTLFKNKYSTDQLQKLGLNERQVKAVLFTIEHGKITNSDYQKINKVSKRTASNDLSLLVTKFNILEKSGTFGAGISYQLKGQ